MRGRSRSDRVRNIIYLSRRKRLPLISRYRDSVSLRLGHARALTPHRGVIHFPRVALLPKVRGFSLNFNTCSYFINSFKNREKRTIFRLILIRMFIL